MAVSITTHVPKSSDNGKGRVAVLVFETTRMFVF
jgi:hypothetical protein